MSLYTELYTFEPVIVPLVFTFPLASIVNCLLDPDLNVPVIFVLPAFNSDVPVEPIYTLPLVLIVVESLSLVIVASFVPLLNVITPLLVFIPLPVINPFAVISLVVVKLPCMFNVFLPVNFSNITSYNGLLSCHKICGFIFFI